MGAPMSVQFRMDKDALMKILERAGDHVQERLPPALAKASGVVLADAQSRVSVDTGQLHRNVVLLTPEVTFQARMPWGKSFPVRITSGFAFLQKYAAVHHEGMWKSGPRAGISFKYPGGGQPKYAENAMKEKQGDFLRITGEELGLG